MSHQLPTYDQLLHNLRTVKSASYRSDPERDEVFLDTLMETVEIILEKLAADKPEA